MKFEKYCDNLIQSFRNGDLDRRSFLGRLGRAAIVTGFVAPSLPALTKYAFADAKPEFLRFDGQGGAWQKALTQYAFERFTAESGVQINQGMVSDSDELLAKVQLASPGEYHYAQLSQEEYVLRWHQMGLLQEIEESKVPGIKNYLMDSSVESFRKLGDGKLFSIPVTQAGVWMVYNTEKISTAEVEEKGFKILLDPAYDKVRTGEDNYIKRIVYAALQTDQDHNNISDFDLLWKTVRESKQRTVKFFKTNAEHIQLFASGEVWLADGRFLATQHLVREGYPIAGWPKQGTYKMYASLACIAGANLDYFYQLANVVLNPDVMLPMALEGGAMPLFDPTKVTIPDEFKSLPGYDPTGTGEGVRLLDAQYWVKNRDMFAKTYTREMARG